jgi:hypothetical protein
MPGLNGNGLIMARDGMLNKKNNKGSLAIIHGRRGMLQSQPLDQVSVAQIRSPARRSGAQRRPSNL